MKNIHSLAIAVALALPLTVNAADQTPMQPGNMNQNSMGGMDMSQGSMGNGTMNMGQGNNMGPDNMQGGNMQGMANGMSHGEIRRVDKSGKKITIKHGPLVNLNMPGMTMVFKVKDPAMLDQVQKGDKVNFVAEEVNGVLTVTKIEKAN